MEFFMTSSFLILCAVALLASLVISISVWIYSRKVAAQMEALRKDYLQLKIDHQHLENQYEIIKDQNLALLERLAKK